MGLTKEEYIAKWRHELGGMIADAATQRLSGAGLSLLLRNLFEKVDATLARQYDDVIPPPRDGIIPQEYE